MTFKGLKTLFLTIGIVSSLALSACTTPTSQRIQEDVHENLNKIESHQNGEIYSVATNLYIPYEHIALKNPKKTEREVMLENEIYTLRGYFDEINNLSADIASITGLPVIVEQGITNQKQLAGSAATSTSISGGSSGATLSSTRDAIKLPFSYHGKLSGMLDLAASKFNVHWEWLGDGEKIRFYKVKSRTWRLSGLPGSTSFKSSVSSDGSGSSSGGGSSQLQAGIEVSDSSVWDSIKQSVEAMITPHGKVVTSPALGTITVSDTPNSLEVIDQFLQSTNASLLKQVVVNIKVLAVDITSSDGYGLNWDAVYSSAGNAITGGISSGISAIEGSSELSLGIIGDGNFTGSKMLISALSKQGKVSQVTSTSAATINNQPVPIQVSIEDKYLGSTETTINSNQSVSGQKLEDTVNGFAANILPHILDGDEVLLQFGIEISREISKTSLKSGEITYQIPKREVRGFGSRVKLRSGDTLIVSGFEQADLSTKQQGVFDPTFALFGGRSESLDSRNTLVILIQPIILED